MEPLSEIFGTLCTPCIYNRAIFRALSYLEPEASSKPCQTCKVTMHIQSPGIASTAFSSIFMNIYAYSGILMVIQPYSQALN